MTTVLGRRKLLLGAGTAGLVLPRVGLANTSFAQWLDGVRSRALQAGIDTRTLDRAFKEIEPDPRVVELDQRQPEGRLTFVEYKTRVVSSARTKGGQRRRREHAALLDRVEQRWGVQSEVLVALWGIESSFGEYKGRFSVVRSLATLAHDGRRAEFFENELIAALRILDEGDIDFDGMFGSWAGAMGQSQFMPSTYLNHAVDADGDGRRNIWTSLDDTFGSMANYLRAVGWDDRYIWGREVQLSRPVDASLAGRKKKVPLSVWQERGVRRVDGRDLPRVAIDAGLIQTDDGAGPNYLVYGNFDALMRWNRSTYFALSVGLLSDAIKAA